jgi:hypothetical protein
MCIFKLTIKMQAPKAMVKPSDTNLVATLTLGSQPRQGLAKVRAKGEPRSHISCSLECKKV